LFAASISHTRREPERFAELLRTLLETVLSDSLEFIDEGFRDRLSVQQMRTETTSHS